MSIVKNQCIGIRMPMLIAAATILGGCAGTSVECAPAALGEEPGKVMFSWKIEDGRRNVEQEAYELTVVDAKGREVWNSGRVESGGSLFVRYGGPDLARGERYGWSVKVWTNRGGRASVGEGGTWYTGLLPEDWRGEWIGVDGTGKEISDEESMHDLSARYLRKEFYVMDELESATLYVCGLGSSVCRINGKRVGEDIFGPLPTWYDASVLYLTYDVLPLLEPGANALGITLGNGRYYGLRNTGDYGTNTVCFGYPVLKAQLLLRYADGREELLVTDRSWRATDKGPITRNNEFDGEHYDADLELGNWTEAGYEEDGRWAAAEVMPSPKGELRQQTSPSLRVQEVLRPETVRMTPDGRVILDMGQNMVGTLKVCLKGTAGKRITMRFAEILEPDDPDRLYTANLRLARAMDAYTPAEDGVFEWEPEFVYHGFRYVEVSGLDYLPDASAFEGKVIYDLMETTGSFETSNEILNAVHRNAYWGIRGNYRGFPTDCPQRDERYPWLGDRATGCFGESYIFGNERLYDKWALDIEESMREDGSISDVSPRYWTKYNENVTWPAAFVYVVKMLHDHFGNTEAVRERYPAMKKWVEYVENNLMVDGTVPYDLYGDWCLPPESPELIHSQDPSRITPGEVLGTTVFYDVLRIMKELCTVAGHPEDAGHYEEVAENIRSAYNGKFLDREAGYYANNTVTANILSLDLGLVPEDLEEQVMENASRTITEVWDSHVAVGVLGVQHLMRGLTDHGQADLAYTIATQDTYPSIGYMYREGTTTIWELWNGNTADPSMNSGNHVMLLGDTVIWMYEDLAGIAAGEPGFRTVRMEPAFPDGLDWVKASYESPCGRIESEWRVKSGRLDWKVEIPANSAAEIRVPKKFGAVLKGGEKISEDGEYTYYRVGSGRYRIR